MYLCILNKPGWVVAMASLDDLSDDAVATGRLTVFRPLVGADGVVRYERLISTWEGPQNPREGRWVRTWQEVEERS